MGVSHSVCLLQLPIDQGQNVSSHDPGTCLTSASPLTPLAECYMTERREWAKMAEENNLNDSSRYWAKQMDPTHSNLPLRKEHTLLFWLLVPLFLRQCSKVLAFPVHWEILLQQKKLHPVISLSPAAHAVCFHRSKCRLGFTPLFTTINGGISFLHSPSASHNSLKWKQ